METLLAIISESTGISTDSRDEMQGKVFFAIRGETFNRNKFASKAISKGAICAVVDEKKVFEKSSSEIVKKFFLVDDVMKTLEEIKKTLQPIKVERSH